MPDACRELDCGDIRFRRRDTDLFTVKVVTLFYLPGEGKIVLILLKIKNKRPVGRDELRATRRVE
ncbi:hypothetical protein SEEH4316_23819 [Salmonella enterica subsp. enterica serovar Heidelberg str. RI-11-014316]|nr:hypothetical protein SEEH4316_23819 [Salmonella enterica subsp. enterica serovar Heidelberg str. RI-11-014316]